MAGQTLSRGEGLRPEYVRAENGNVAISGTIDLPPATDAPFLRSDLVRNRKKAAFRGPYQSPAGSRNHIEPLLRGAGGNGRTASCCSTSHMNTNRLNRYRISTAVLATHRDTASAPSSRAFRFRGDLPRETTISVAITWYAARSRRDRRRTPRRGKHRSGKSRAGISHGHPGDDGHWVQIPGSMAGRIGTACKWTRPHSPVLLYDMLVRAAQSAALRLGDLTH